MKYPSIDKTTQEAQYRVTVSAFFEDIKDHIYSHVTHGEVNLHDVWDVTYSNAVNLSTSEATMDSILKTNV